MDGLTLLAELRKRQSPVRAIIVSAYGDMANIRTAMNHGSAKAAPVKADTRGVTISAKVPVDMAERTTAEARRLGLAVSAVIGKTIVIPAPVIAPFSAVALPPPVEGV
jgi:DNA-binding NarL/FixJ family response regulator